MLLLAWRNLTQSRTQLFLGIGGVTLAILLMLALDALLTGSEEDLVAYIERSGADIFVSQDGVRNMHMAASAITWRDKTLAEHAPGVVDGSAILFTTTTLEAGDANILSYIIGYDPDELLGGPPAVIAGTTRLKEDEAIIDEAVARSQDLGLGDNVEVFGEEFIVAGITRGLTNIVNSVTFIRLQDFQEMRQDDVISYALLATEPGADVESVAAAIMARNDDVTALPRAEFSREERQIIRDMSVEVLNIMSFSGLLIGLAVTALTLYTNTLRKRPEYGVLKAIGARNTHLFTVILVQAVISVMLGLAVALCLVWFMGRLLPLAVPSLAMTLTWGSVTRVLLLSGLVGAVSTLIPAWEMARLDPAQVFRG